MFKPKKIPLKTFEYVYNRVPRLCVDLVIKTSEGVVLSKRDIPPSKGKWHIPGGTILFKEKLEDAIKRIALEETGLKLEIIDTIGTIEFFIPTVIGHAVSIVHLCKPVSGKLRGSFQGKEIKYFKSVPPNTIKEQAKFLFEKNLIMGD